MRIASVQTYPVTLAVKPAFHIVSSAGAHAVSRYAVVAVRADDGLTGWGEATVVPLWTGEVPPDCEQARRLWLAVLRAPQPAARAGHVRVGPTASSARSGACCRVGQRGGVRSSV